MWAVFRYSTGVILSYFTDERSAATYVLDQILYDAALGIMVPDWGYKLCTVSTAVDELCNGLDA